MKSGIAVLLLLFTIQSFGQSRHLMNQISQDLNHELEGGMLRDTRLGVRFEKEAGRIIYSYNGFPDPGVSKVLNQYADSLMVRRTYNALIYYDRHSSQAYAYVDTVSSSPLFINYDQSTGFPLVHRQSLMDSVYIELRKYRQAIDSLKASDWSEPIYLLIGNETPEVIKSNKLVRYLDTSLRISWSKPYYHGYQMNSIAEIRLDKSYLDIMDRRLLLKSFFEVQVSYVLPEHYRNQWVRFSEREPEYPGNIMVSFVFDPTVQKLVDPVILKGEYDDATPLIEWINESNLPGTMFHWKSNPFVKRVYFLIDKN